MGRDQTSESERAGEESSEHTGGRAYRPQTIEESLIFDTSYLTKWLYDRFGAALRTVLVYDGAVSEYTYLAGDVGAMYTDTELDRIADEHAFQDALSHPHYESLFHLGDTEATVTLFEDATLLQVPFDDATGVAFAVERGCAVDVDDVVTTLRGEYRPEFVSGDG